MPEPRTDICQRCAVPRDWAGFPSKTQARKAGEVGDTDYHTERDCIARLRDIIEEILERLP